MTANADAHSDQIDYWNSRGGTKWVAAQSETDIMLAPVSRALLERIEPAAGLAVLDIGCGCGATTLDLALAVGSAGRVFGIDVSQPMLDVAKSRVAGYPQVELTCADASVYPFEPFADLAASRFGVMFFGDPAAAFKNIRRALKPNGRLLFACWRELGENPWMQVPLHAVYDARVPRLPRPQPEDPGPFSFANPERVTKILTSGGFKAPSFSRLDLSLDIAAGGGYSAAVRQSLTIGAASRALQDQPKSLQEAAALAVEKALVPYVSGEGVLLPAAIWFVESEAI